MIPQFLFKKETHWIFPFPMSFFYKEIFMYTSILQNFVKNLIENEFSIAPAFHMGVIEEDSIVILLKQEMIMLKD